jgi:hypothetical protein
MTFKNVKLRKALSSAVSKRGEMHSPHEYHMLNFKYDGSNIGENNTYDNRE